MKALRVGQLRAWNENVAKRGNDDLVPGDLFLVTDVEVAPGRLRRERLAWVHCLTPRNGFQDGEATVSYLMANSEPVADR